MLTYGLASGILYDPANRQTAVTNAEGETTQSVYYPDSQLKRSLNPLGFATSYVYDKANRPRRVTNPENESTTSVYYPDGQLKRSIDPLNHTTSYVYDPANRQIALVNARGFRTTSTYYADGQLKATLDPLLLRSTTTYDLANRPVTQSDPRGFATATTYYPDGQPKAAIDQLGHRTTTTYDQANRAKTVTNARGFVTTSTYYADGQLRSSRLPLAGIATYTYDAANRQLTATNPANETTTSRYYPDGQLRATINPLGFWTTFTYDLANRRVATLDAELHQTGTKYDAAGRTIADVDALSHRVTYTYDKADRRTRLTDARAHSTDSVYDDAGREVVRIDALLRRTTFAYDPVGNRTLLADACGHQTVYAYDADNRRRTHVATDGVRYTYTYDNNANRTLAETTHGPYAAAYTPRNETAATANPDNQRITYTYDQVGDRSRMLDPDGGRYTYTYDARRRQTGLVNPKEERTTLAYDQADRVTAKTLSSQQTAAHVYNAAGWLTSLTNTSGLGMLVSQFGYVYDQTGHRTEVTEASGAVTTWTYDAKYQLRNERRSGLLASSITHTYDPAGNRTVQIENGFRTSYTYDAANQLSGTTSQCGGDTGYVYDASGNLIQQDAPAGITFYTYDSEYHLRQAEPPGGLLLFTYDADDRRVRKESSCDATKFIYDGNKLLQETDDDNDPTREYTFTTEQEWGNLVSEDLGGVTEYHAYDGLGSTDALLDDSGYLAERHAYRAFGQPQAGGESQLSHLTFVGQQSYYRDPELDLYLLGSGVRFYDPATARFLSQDPMPPLGDQDNLYRYVGNHPTMSVDPSGLEESGVEHLLRAGDPAPSGEQYRPLYSQMPRTSRNGFSLRLLDDPIPPDATQFPFDWGSFWESRWQRIMRENDPDYIKHEERMRAIDGFRPLAVFRFFADLKTLETDKNTFRFIENESRYEGVWSGWVPSLKMTGRSVWISETDFRGKTYKLVWAIKGAQDGRVLATVVDVGDLESDDRQLAASWFNHVRDAYQKGDEAVVNHVPFGGSVYYAVRGEYGNATFVTIRDAVAIGPMVAEWNAAASAVRSSSIAATKINPASEIARNADLATEMTRRAAARGRLNGTAQHFGDYAHQRFEQLNNRLGRRLIDEGSTFCLDAEQFRNALGRVVSRRASGSIGADVVLTRFDDPAFIKVFDLKTHGGVLRPISSSRQTEFLRRFGANAEELFRQR